jgi:uncharacterized protein YfaP (DUF2135 family)
MKLQLYFRIFVSLLVTTFLWIGCAKDDPSPLEKFRILQAHNSIDSMASKALLMTDPITAFKNLLPEIQSKEGVESAEVVDLSLFVTYINGGTESWTNTLDPYYLPYVEKAKPTVIPIKISNSGATSERNDPGLVGNKRVCIINQVINDQRFEYAIPRLNNVKSAFENANFTVDMYNGAAADLRFFRDNINAYGTVFLVTHGSYRDGVTWITTGEKIQNFQTQVLTEHFEAFSQRKIGVSSIREVHGNDTLIVTYYKVSSQYFDQFIADGSFPNTLFYTASCQGLKNDDLWEVLNKKGCQSIVGWSDTNKKGVSVGQEFFYKMLSGKNVEETFATFSAESLTDEGISNGIQYKASLKYKPLSTGGKARLFEAESKNLPIEITSVSNNQISTSRVVNIRGKIKDASALSSAILEIGGSAVKLEYNYDFTFNQNIEILAGNNTVRITATGTHKEGGPASGEIKINIIGQFPPLELWTKLRWNTDDADVDLHLLKPGAGYDDLFTEKDCYYYNKSTSFNAYLDVDDIDGWGPEHIAIPDQPEPGLYTLVVHHYGTNGDVGTAADISVETKTFKWHSSQLPLNYGFTDSGNGDAWAVCQIEFPSGKIIPIQQKIATPRDGSIVKAKKDKRQPHVSLK